MPFNHLILFRPVLHLPSIFPSIRVFSNESALCIRWSKYWSFSFNISPSNEHLGLISFRMDWLDLLVVQGTLKSLLQHHSSKASILWCSALFIVQLYLPQADAPTTCPIPLPAEGTEFWVKTQSKAPSSKTPPQATGDPGSLSCHTPKPGLRVEVGQSWPVPPHIPDARANPPSESRSLQL